MRPLRLGVRQILPRISPAWGRWVGEKIWHESQKIRKLAEGSLEILFRIAGLDGIVAFNTTAVVRFTTL